MGIVFAFIAVFLAGNYSACNQRSCIFCKLEDWNLRKETRSKE